jgi:hypothetical protein
MGQMGHPLPAVPVRRLFPAFLGRITEVCLVVFIWRLNILVLDRTADRTPVLVAGESVTLSAGITGFCVGGHTNNLILVAPCPVMTDR